MKIKYITLLLMLLTGCTKDFLEPKPDKKLVVPTTLKDMQALLDNTGIMNTSMSRMGEVGSDDYYVLATNWNNISGAAISEKQGYIWQKDLYRGENNVRDWNDRYSPIFYCNVVLEGLEQLGGESNSQAYRETKGSSLFFRAKSHFELSQLFIPPFIRGTENQLLGIPLRLDADINKKNTRSTVAQTYAQIVADLEQAVDLLGKTSAHLTRPNKVAALSMLARVYLSMQDYEHALQYSSRAIDETNATLLDFNNVSNATYPMRRYNSEVIHHNTLLRGVILSNSMLLVDQNLYDMYEPADLRKSLWFSGTSGNLRYKGSYDASITMFSGITLAEVYLIKAECLARIRSTNDEALAALNTLLVKRYNKNSFTPITTISNADLLNRILQERRKELVYRGIRWSDLRRLNLDASRAVTLQRNLNGTVYVLKPNSVNYTLPIPDDAILLGGYEQNPRE